MAGKIENPTLAEKLGKIARSTADGTAPRDARGRPGRLRSHSGERCSQLASGSGLGSARLGSALAVAALALAVAVAAVALAVHASPKVGVSRR